MGMRADGESAESGLRLAMRGLHAPVSVFTTLDEAPEAVQREAMHAGVGDIGYLRGMGRFEGQMEPAFRRQ